MAHVAVCTAAESEPDNVTAAAAAAAAATATNGVEAVTRVPHTRGDGATTAPERYEHGKEKLITITITILQVPQCVLTKIDS